MSPQRTREPKVSRNRRTCSRKEHILTSFRARSRLGGRNFPNNSWTNLRNLRRTLGGGGAVETSSHRRLLRHLVATPVMSTAGFVARARLISDNNRFGLFRNDRETEPCYLILRGGDCDKMLANCYLFVRSSDEETVETESQMFLFRTRILFLRFC